MKRIPIASAVIAAEAGYSDVLLVSVAGFYANYLPVMTRLLQSPEAGRSVANFATPFAWLGAGAIRYLLGVFDIGDIRRRYQAASAFLDERGRRLFVANEALALGYGGITAASMATGVARSTINRGIAELRAGRPDQGPRRGVHRIGRTPDRSAA